MATTGFDELGAREGGRRLSCDLRTRKRIPSADDEEDGLPDPLQVLAIEALAGPCAAQSEHAVQEALVSRDVGGHGLAGCEAVEQFVREALEYRPVAHAGEDGAGLAPAPPLRGHHPGAQTPARPQAPRPPRRRAHPPPPPP